MSYGISFRVERGPREEIQDFPFRFHLAASGGRRALYTAELERDDAERAGDLWLAGVLDGMGGTALPITDVDALEEVTPFFHQHNLISRRFKGAPGVYLTGRAAVGYLYFSLRRHGVRLGSDYGLRDLIEDCNRDLHNLNNLLMSSEVVASEGARPIGAALTVAVLDADGLAEYANCGDCRAVLVRSVGEGYLCEELSHKQTMARLESEPVGTTTGMIDDHRIFNAIGNAAAIQPRVRSEPTRLGPRDVILQMTDGAREAFMYHPDVAGIDWDKRELAAVASRVIPPYLAERAVGHTSDLIRVLFERVIRPHVARTPGKVEVGKVLDNVSLIGARRATAVEAALDQLYQGIQDGEVESQKDPPSIRRAELERCARLADLRASEQVEELVDQVRAAGFEIAS